MNAMLETENYTCKAGTCLPQNVLQTPHSLNSTARKDSHAYMEKHSQYAFQRS